MESNGLKLAFPWFHTFISPYTTHVTPSTRLFPRPTTVHGCTRPARAVRLTAVAGQSTDDPRRQQTRGHHGGTRPQQFSPRPPSLRFCVIAVVCLCLFVFVSLLLALRRAEQKHAVRPELTLRALCDFVGCQSPIAERSSPVEPVEIGSLIQSRSDQPGGLLQAAARRALLTSRFSANVVHFKNTGERSAIRLIRGANTTEECLRWNQTD